MLERHADLSVVGEAEDGEAAAKLVGPLGVRVVLLNLSPAGRGCIDVVRKIVAAEPGVRVLALMFEPAAHTIRELLASGAAGCLSRECAATELVAAIRRVAGGRTYLSSSLVESVVHVQRQSTKMTLAPREREVLRAIAMGRSTKEIAAAMRVTAKTVETHRRRLMEKLKVGSVAELTKYAVLQGMTPLEVAG